MASHLSPDESAALDQRVDRLAYDADLRDLIKKALRTSDTALKKALVSAAAEQRRRNENDSLYQVWGVTGDQLLRSLDATAPQNRGRHG
jgi:hypothetical protein